MLNVYDFMKDLPPTKKLLVNDLLFAEYECPLSEKRYDMWSHYNYFVYVMKGKKKWFTGDNEILAKAGDCIFVQKGAHSIYQFFDNDFCSLFMFVSDEFIRETLLENRLNNHTSNDETASSPIIRVQTNKMLSAYFYSFLVYISSARDSDTKMTELKFRELIMIANSDLENEHLRTYFQNLCKTTRPSIQAVMESNFYYPMILKEFAQLSGRSLSVFKRDFKDIYNETPGRWLTNKRLELARYLLTQTDKTVTEVVFECGFKNTSHFSRIFKKMYGISPVHFKKNVKASNPNG